MNQAVTQMEYGLAPANADIRAAHCQPISGEPLIVWRKHIAVLGLRESALQRGEGLTPLRSLSHHCWRTDRQTHPTQPFPEERPLGTLALGLLAVAAG